MAYMLDSYQDELLPCPFCCGNAAVMFESGGDRGAYFVMCLECGVETPRTFKTGKLAKDAWNRRVEPSWLKECSHIFVHVGGHQPTKETETEPPNCESSVQKSKEHDQAKRFFTSEEVRAMSQTEVRQNFAAILQSMSKW